MPPDSIRTPELYAAPRLEPGADDDLGALRAQRLHRLPGDGGVGRLAPALLRRGGLSGARADVAVHHRLEPLDHIGVVSQAGAEEMGEERRGRVAGNRDRRGHEAVSFAPMRGNGGRKTSPGRPTAAPLTAGTPLSME